MARSLRYIPARTKRTISTTYRKFLREATCHDLNKGRSGRPRTARTPENIEFVRESLTQHGNRSSRRNGLGLSRSSFHHIAKLDIKFHPYVMITRQKLREGELVQRMAFCNRLVHTVEQNPQFLDESISDEAVFSLISEVNTTNFIKYAPYGNGHPADHYVKFAPDQVMVWVGTRTGIVLGPHFAARLNLDTREYLRIIRYYFTLQREFNIHNIDRYNMWWQQDGAPATMQYLRGQFPLRLISKRGD